MFVKHPPWIYLLVYFLLHVIQCSDESGPAEYFQFVGEDSLLPCGQEPPKNGMLFFYNTTYVEGDPPTNTTTIVRWVYPDDIGQVMEGYTYHSDTGLLTVINTTLAHGGNYSCWTFDYKTQKVTELFLYVGVPLEHASINGHQTGSNLTAVESCPVSVECGVEGVAPANITLEWSLQPSNHPLDQDVISTIANDDLTFNVSSILTVTFNRTHHGMTLMCTATHGFQQNNQITANISLIMLYEYRTNVSESRQEEVAVVGGSKSLDCLTVEPGHLPSSHYLWYKDGRLIDEGGGRMLGLGSRQLNITGLRRSDEGEYGCSVNNTAGSGVTEHTFTLHVSRGPSGQPSIVPTDPVILVNTSFTLVCNTSSLNDSGYPPASEYVWTQNRTVVPGEDDSRLVIRYDSVTEGDEYTCSVKNIYNTSEVSAVSQTTIEAFLYVEENGDMNYTPLVNDTSFTFNTTISGSNLRRTWFTKDSSPIPDTDFTCTSLSIEGEFRYGQDKAHLIDCSWSMKDKSLDSCETVTYYDGNYHLKAEGEAAGRQNIISTAFSIETLYPPVASSEVSWITNSSLNITQNLTCAVCSNPFPHRYTWTFNSGELPAGIVDHGKSLEISSVQMDHFGSYICEVSNLIEGTEFTRHFTMVLVEKGPPHKVGNLRVKSITSRTIQLSWTVGGNGGYKILEHQIEYEDLVEGGGNGPRMNYSDDCVTVGAPCQYRIQGLNPATKYRVSVRAKNANTRYFLGGFSTLEATTTALPIVKPGEIVVEEDHITVNWFYEVFPSSLEAVSVSIVIEYKEINDEKYNRHPKNDRIPAHHGIAKIAGNFDLSRSYNVDILVYENSLDDPTMRQSSEIEAAEASSSLPVWATVLIVLFSIILLVIVIGFVLGIYRHFENSSKQSPDDEFQRLDRDQETSPVYTGLIGVSYISEQQTPAGHPQPSSPPETIELQTQPQPSQGDQQLDPAQELYDDAKSQSDETAFQDACYEVIPSQGIPEGAVDGGGEDFSPPIEDIYMAELRGRHPGLLSIDGSTLCQKRVLPIKGYYGEIRKYRKVPKKRRRVQREAGDCEMVVVKAIAKDHPAIEDFIREGRNMMKFNHKNILTALGFSADENCLLLVLPNIEFGNLCAALKEQPYEVADLAKFCLETAEGMKYLASQTPPIIHGNLRSENLLIDSSYTVSITAIGKPRKDSHYIRWLDQEHLYDKDLPLNEKSDVWAYAVTIGEIFSNGGLPYIYYQDTCIKEIILIKDKHKEKLPNCPSSIHKVMMECFGEEKDRPTFHRLVNRMLDIIKKKDFACKTQVEPGNGIMRLLDSDLCADIPAHSFNMENIKLDKFLGKGHFGRVHLYLWVNNSIDCPDPSKKFAVKSLIVKNRQDQILEVEEFLWEGILAMNLNNHENVLSPYGVHIDDDSAFIVLPYMEGGSLQNLLREKNLDKHSLIVICLGIARGMEYIAQNEYVHRELATRNVLVGEKFCVKVADFGLACDVFKYQYYRDSRRRSHPTKWIAPECHVEDKFSEKSDVWSFAITMWEIFNKAQEPYPGIDCSQIREHVLNGGRPEKTDTCPSSMFDIMTKCLATKPEDRPSFNQLTTQLEDIKLHAQPQPAKITKNGNKRRTAKKNPARSNHPGTSVKTVGE